jgi:hypothetical protein
VLLEMLCKGGLGGGGHKNTELFRRVVGEAFLYFFINFNLRTFFGSSLRDALRNQGPHFYPFFKQSENSIFSPIMDTRE